MIGLLAWYDEPVNNLATVIASMSKIGASHLVAVDGAYALYPDGRAESPPAQAAALVMMAREAGIGLTLHAPDAPWEGNEAEKRNALFALGWAAARPGDWFYGIDADEVVGESPPDLKARLEASEADVALIGVVDEVAEQASQANWPDRFTTRRLFRAQPITLGRNHFTYTTADGRVLFGGGDPRVEHPDHLDLSQEFIIRHRPHRREPDRQRAKMAYYQARDDAGVEFGSCDLCPADARARTETNWRVADFGPIADLVEVCPDCFRKVKAANDKRLRSLGIDPRSVVVRHRDGQAPAALPEARDPAAVARAVVGAALR